MKGLMVLLVVLMMGCSPEIPDYDIPEILEKTIEEAPISEAPISKTPINEYLGNGYFNLIDDTEMTFKIIIDNKKEILTSPELIHVIGDTRYYVNEVNKTVKQFPYTCMKTTIKGPGNFHIYINGTMSQWVKEKSYDNWILRRTVKVKYDYMSESPNDYILLSRAIIDNVSTENYPIVKVITELNGEEITINL